MRLDCELEGCLFTPMVKIRKDFFHLANDMKDKSNLCQAEEEACCSRRGNAPRRSDTFSLTKHDTSSACTENVSANCLNRKGLMAPIWENNRRQKSSHTGKIFCSIQEELKGKKRKKQQQQQINKSPWNYSENPHKKQMLAPVSLLYLQTLPIFFFFFLVILDLFISYFWILGNLDIVLLVKLVLLIN